MVAPEDEARTNRRRDAYCTGAPAKPETRGMASPNWGRCRHHNLVGSGAAEALAHQYDGRGVDARNGRVAYVALKTKYISTLRAALMDFNASVSRKALEVAPTRPRGISTGYLKSCRRH